MPGDAAVTRLKEALVFGCGPAGLMAAHALTQNDYVVRIVSKKRKSEMFGAQYLHAPIPGATPAEEGKRIDYLLSGSIKGYREKVYGENWSGTVSPDEYGNEEAHFGWDIRATYDRLWQMYSPYIENIEFPHGAAVEHFLDTSHYHYDMVVSSLPAPALCLRREEHVFNFQKVWAIGDAPERGVFCPVNAAPPYSVLCNGEPDVGWYRTANVFGYTTAEWPDSRRPPYEGVAEVIKPLNTTCDCQPQIARVGRFGLWQKGVLSHEAYYGIKDALEKVEA